jgi:hypothetical protein
MKKRLDHVTQKLIVILMLVFLPGCKWFTGKVKDVKKETADKKTVLKQGSGVTLCSINGEAVIKESDLNQILQSDPRLRGIPISYFPMAIKKQFFDKLQEQKIILAYSKKKKIYDNPEFIKKYKEIRELVKDSLMVQFFEEELFKEIEIGESEIKKHFDEHKNNYIKVMGGVLVQGAEFDSEDLASKFLEQTKDKSNKFEKLASQDKNVKFENFGRVTEKEQKNSSIKKVPGPIKETALALKKLPAVEKVKVGKKHWVIAVSDKKETVYHDLGEVEEYIKEELKRDALGKKLKTKLTELRSSMTIETNEDYFKEKAPAENIQNATPNTEKKAAEAA